MGKRLLTGQKIIVAVIILALTWGLTSWGEAVEAAKPAGVSPVSIDVYPDRAQYRPGELVTILVEIENNRTENMKGVLNLDIRHLSAGMFADQCRVAVPAGKKQTVRFFWQPPVDRLEGYGVDVVFNVSRPAALALRGSTAFDVAADWTLAPRYGFLSDFSPQEASTAEKLAEMNKYHINVIQFYDWMYRHDQLLPPRDEFFDPLGRRLSLDVVKEKIAAARKHGMESMAYTAIYGASPAFFKQHPGWGLYRLGDKPWDFGNGFLYIMDPSRGSGWHDHLLGEFEKALRLAGFDGIHIDQYGEPKQAHTKSVNGESRLVELDEAFADFINDAKERVAKVNPKGKVIFNAVAAWPLTTVAPSRQDVNYIEVWPPYRLHGDLKSLVYSAKELSGGKEVVLAAYISPLQESAVRLADASIFASGGYHIELGEGRGMLADPYFPKYQKMSPELAGTVRRYYDFIVRYVNLLYDGVRPSEKEALELTGDIQYTTAEGPSDEVWGVEREKPGYYLASLINFTGLLGSTWNVVLGQPKALSNIGVKYHADKAIANIFVASPDGEDLNLVSLPFNRGEDESGPYVSFVIPSLEYWDLLVLKQEE